MPRVFVSSVVNAPAEKVWAAIGRFDAAADWLPFVKSSPIEDGSDPARVGCVRVVTQTDGAVFREVLVALSERSYSYTFVGSAVARMPRLCYMNVEISRPYCLIRMKFEPSREIFF